MHDLTENKRLLDKHALLESMLERLRGDGVPEDELADVSISHFRKSVNVKSLLFDLRNFLLQQLSDSMTTAEKSLVTKIHSMSDNLTLGQTQADETILILESYLKFKSMD